MPAMLTRIWTRCVNLAHHFGWGRVFGIALLENVGAGIGINISIGGDDEDFSVTSVV